MQAVEPGDWVWSDRGPAEQPQNEQPHPANEPPDQPQQPHSKTGLLI